MHVQNSAVDLSKPISKKRNYGIDLLRLVSMFFVIILHSLNRGGVLKNAPVESSQYIAAWFLEIFAFCAVDIFALISGYVSYSEREKRINLTNYALLWLQVVAYCVSLMIIFQLCIPESVTKLDLAKGFFPVTNNTYWYFTAYTGLFAVMPLLNAALHKCSEETLRKVFVCLFLLFSLFDTFAKKFEFSSGYSFVWITILYIMGAIIKKCKIGEKVKPIYLIILIIALSLIGWGWKIYGFQFKILDITVTKDFFVNYTSPTVLGSAILYIILFSKLRINKITQKIVAFAAPGAFAAYILNTHPLILKYIIDKQFLPIIDRNFLVIWLAVLVYSLCFLIISIFIDKIRMLIFNLLHIRQIVNKFINFAEKAIWCVAKRL